MAHGAERALEQTLSAHGAERALERTAWAPGTERALEQTLSAHGAERALERTLSAPGTQRAHGAGSGADSMGSRNGLPDRGADSILKVEPLKLRARLIYPSSESSGCQ